jgi:hypothetical protein
MFTVCIGLGARRPLHCKKQGANIYLYTLIRPKRKSQSEKERGREGPGRLPCSFPALLLASSPCPLPPPTSPTSAGSDGKSVGSPGWRSRRREVDEQGDVLHRLERKSVGWRRALHHIEQVAMSGGPEAQAAGWHRRLRWDMTLCFWCCLVLDRRKCRPSSQTQDMSAKPTMD